VSDRLGRRGAILIGLGASAGAFVVFGLATNIWMLFLSRAVQGIGGGTTGVLQAYVADVTEPRDRARALGWLSAATNGGVMIGPAIGSLSFQLGPAAPGLFAAALCLANVYFARRWLPESREHRHEHAQGERRSVGTMVWDYLRTPHGDVARLVWVYAVGMLGFMSMTAVLAIFLQDRFGITESTIGLFFVYTGALGIVMRAVVLGRLVDWLGETRVLRTGAALLAAGLFLIPFPESILTLALAAGLVPIGTACLFPAVTALVTHRASPGERGQVLGVQQAFGGVARVIAPIWATAAFQGLGRSVPFFIASGVVGVVVLLAFRISEVPQAAAERLAGG
jgi:MFS family permease